MKRLNLLVAICSLFIYTCATLSAQQMPQNMKSYWGEVVFNNDDLTIRQIDEHTWIGSGKVMSSEAIYIIEGEQKAILLDAGTRIADLDKIVAQITDKPVTLLATHLHPDHTGSAINYFPEIWIGSGDEKSEPQYLGNYKGKVNYLTEGQIWDLGGRKLEVVYTPGHTGGSITLIDKEAGYGFSGDAFGSGNLLLFTDFSTLIATCEKMSAKMEKDGIEYLFPGHFFGVNVETVQRLKDQIEVSRGVLSGELKGGASRPGGVGGKYTITKYGFNIVYDDAQLK